MRNRRCVVFAATAARTSTSCMLLSAVSEVRAASCRTCLALDGTRVLPNQQTAEWAHPRLGSPRGALKSQSVPPRAPGAFARGRRRSRRRAPTAVGRAACSARSTRRSCSCSSSCTAHGSSGTSAAQTTLTRRTWHNPRTPRGHARALARTDDSSVQAVTVRRCNADGMPRRSWWSSMKARSGCCCVYAAAAMRAGAA